MHPEPDLDRLVEDLTRASRDRLVLLAPIGQDQTGFTTMTRTSIEQALERAIAASPESREAALLVLKELGAKGRIGPLAAKARQLTSAHSKPWPSEQPRTAGPAVTLADALPAHTSAWDVGLPTRAFRNDLRRIRTTKNQAESYDIPDRLSVPESAARVVPDRAALQQVVEAVSEIDPQNWAARAAIASLLWIARERLPVADALTTPDSRPYG